MIGLIHHVLFDSLKENLGSEIVEKIYAAAGIPADREFRMDQYYSDEEWQTIFAMTIKHTGLSEQEVNKYYAHEFRKYGEKLFPMWFSMAKNSHEFLGRQPAIHNSIASGLHKSEDRKKVTDKFKMDIRPRQIITTYCSPNKHCALFKDLAYEIAGRYGDTIEISESTCMHHGDESCCITIDWVQFGGADDQ